MASWSDFCSIVALCAAVGCFRLLLILRRHVSLLAGAAASNVLDNNESKRGRERARDLRVAETRSTPRGAHQTRNRVDPQGFVFSDRFERVWLAFDSLLDCAAVVENDASLDSDANLLKRTFSAAVEDAVAAGIAAAEQKMALAFQVKMAQVVVKEMGEWRVMQEGREAWWQRKFDREENKLGTALAAAVASHEDAMAARDRKCAATVASVRDEVLQLKEQAADNAAGKAADDAAREKAALADLLRSINATHQRQQEEVVGLQQEMREGLARKVEEASSASRHGDRPSAAAEASPPPPPSMDDTTKLRNVKSDLDSLGARLLVLEGIASPRRQKRILYRVHERVLESFRVWGEEPFVGPQYTDWVLKKASGKTGPGARDEEDENATPPKKGKGESGKEGSMTEEREEDDSASNGCMSGGGEGGQGRAPSA